MNVFYVWIRATEDYEFDKIRTAGVSGNATNYKNSQGDNPICSTRDEISQPTIFTTSRHWGWLCTAVPIWLLICSNRQWYHKKTIFLLPWHFTTIFFVIDQGYSIILRKGPVTNVKIFRSPVTPIKSCKCDMPWIFLTKNVIWEFNTIILYIDIQNPVNG